MHHILQSRAARFTTVALGGMLLMNSAGLAQTVRIFDDAPSIEQLRSIMIPESRGGQSRSIVLLRPDMPRNNVVQAAVQPVDPPQAMRAVQTDPVPTAVIPTAVIPTAVMPAVVMPAPVRQVVAKPAPRAAVQDEAGDKAGIVGFRINFALASATLPSGSYAFIDRMAELLKQEPQVTLRVEGHTDALGSAEYNQGLSERRAAAVADYLVHQRGIAAERLVIEGKGMTEPMTSDPFDGQNRRVQFVRLG